MSDPSIDILSRYIKQLLNAVLEAAGHDVVRCIFVGGSVAGGEVASRVGDGVVEYYSDVDLYVVVDDRADTDGLGSLCAAAAGDVPLRGEDYVFYRGPDIGVYTFEDLANQPARPGTVGFGRRHMLLYGEDGLPAQVAKRIGEKIDPAESFYLLEHRLLELSLLDPEASEDGYVSYVACKTCLDAAAATLVADGIHTPDRTERVRKLFALGMDRDLGWSEEQLALVNRCETALGRMPERDWAQTVPAGDTLAAATTLALDVWKHIASRAGGDWSSTLLRRCHKGEYLRNFRQFRALNSRRGFRRGSLLSGTSLARCSPVDVLRMSALIDYLNRDRENQPEINGVMATVGPYLDKLTRVCGFENGTLVERSTRMYRAL